LDCLKARSPDLVSRAEPLCDALAEVYFTSRYPGFDFDEPNWPELRRQIEQLSTLLEQVRARLPGAA
jgi:hypothetical protein